MYYKLYIFWKVAQNQSWIFFCVTFVFCIDYIEKNGQFMPQESVADSRGGGGEGGAPPPAVPVKIFFG